MSLDLNKVKYTDIVNHIQHNCNTDEYVDFKKVIDIYSLDILLDNLSNLLNKDIVEINYYYYCDKCSNKSDVYNNLIYVPLKCNCCNEEDSIKFDNIYVLLKRVG